MDSRTFKINPNIEMKKVHFKNRFGIDLAGVFKCYFGIFHAW